MNNNVIGTYKQRGNEGIENLPTLVEFAQDHFIKDIINVGTDGADWVSVVTTFTGDGLNTLQMVRREPYALMDFTTDYEKNAFNNLSESVAKFVGAYSNRYDLGYPEEIITPNDYIKYIHN